MPVNPDELSSPFDTPGRKALFATIESHHEQVSSPPSLKDIINQLVAYDGEGVLQLPGEWEPLIAKISTLLHTYSEKNAEYTEVCNELKTLSDSLHIIEEEHQMIDAQYKDIHATYNAFYDEIKAERAFLSESFAHHQIPMALLTSEREIISANDAFFSLLNGDQKEDQKVIETGNQLSIEFCGEEEGEIIITSDHRLRCTILSPPPVFPGAMHADSLVILKPDFQEKTKDLHHVYEEIIDLFSFPTVILGKDLMIVHANDAFYIFADASPHTLNSLSVDSHIMTMLHHAVDEILEQKLERFEASFSRDGVKQNVTVHLFSAGEQVLCVLVPDEEPDKGVDIGDLFIETLLPTFPSPLAVLNEHFAIIALNDAFSELYGIPSQDFINLPVRELGLFTISDESLHHRLQNGAVSLDPVQVSSSYGDEQCTVSFVPLHDSMKRILLQLVPTQSSHQTSPAVPTSDSHADDIDDAGTDEFLSSSTFPIIICDASGLIIAWSPSCIECGFSPVVGTHYSEYFIPASNGTGTDSVLVCNIQNKNQLFQLYTATVKGQKEIMYMLVPRGNEFQRIDQLSDENRFLSERILAYKEKIEEMEEATIHAQEEEHDIDVLVFSIGKEYYAMDVLMVREVVEMIQITPIPRTPPHILGIINLRGEVTNVIDFARVLGTSPLIDRELQKIIVLPSHQTNGEQLSVIVDNVYSVVTISSKQMSSLGDEISDQIHLHMKGIIRLYMQDVFESMIVHEEETVPTLIILLDMPALIASIRR